MGKADVLAQIIFCCKVVVVLFKLFPARDGGREVCLWLEGICVVVCWNIARTTGVSVFKPCSSDLRIFLINLECRVSQISFHPEVLNTSYCKVIVGERSLQFVRKAKARDSSPYTDNFDEPLMVNCLVLRGVHGALRRTTVGKVAI